MTVAELKKELEYYDDENMKECKRCGFNNEYGFCECPPYDKWYACPIEANKPENIKALKEYAEWVSKEESEEKK